MGRCDVPPLRTAYCYRMNNVPPQCREAEQEQCFYLTLFNVPVPTRFVTQYISNSISRYRLLRRSILGTAVDWPITVLFVSLQPTYAPSPSSHPNQERDRGDSLWQWFSNVRGTAQATMTTSTLLEHHRRHRRLR